MRVRGHTPTSYTGPRGDHTTGVGESFPRSFLYSFIQSSCPDKMAGCNLVCETWRINTSPHCFSFESQHIRLWQSFILIILLKMSERWSCWMFSLFSCIQYSVLSSYSCNNKPWLGSIKFHNVKSVIHGSVRSVLLQGTSCTSRRPSCVRVTKLGCWPLTCGAPPPLSVWSSITTCMDRAPGYWACFCGTAAESRTRCCGGGGVSRASAGWGRWWTTAAMSDTRYEEDRSHRLSPNSTIVRQHLEIPNNSV